jgi:5-methylcytosine-specific restriction endonuclease McrA
MSVRRRFNRLERLTVFVRADGKCQRCRTPLTIHWHCDHVVPVNQGGLTC